MPTQSWANRSSVLVVCWYLVAEASCTPHPLAAFIFSRDKAAIDRFIGELSFGGGAVNQVNIHLFIETMPFGGVGPIRYGSLLRQVWLRHAYACQIDAHLAPGCSH